MTLSGSASGRQFDAVPSFLMMSMSSSVVSGCRKRYARNAVSYVFFFLGLSSAAVAVAVVDDIMSNGLGNDANMSLIWTGRWMWKLKF